MKKCLNLKKLLKNKLGTLNSQKKINRVMKKE